RIWQHGRSGLRRRSRFHESTRCDDPDRTGQWHHQLLLSTLLRRRDRETAPCARGSLRARASVARRSRLGLWLEVASTPFEPGRWRQSSVALALLFSPDKGSCKPTSFAP